MLAAASAIVFTIPMVLVAFAYTYVVIGAQTPTNFSESLTKVDSFYGRIWRYCSDLSKSARDRKLADRNCPCSSRRSFEVLYLNRQEAAPDLRL